MKSPSEMSNEEPKAILISGGQVINDDGVFRLDVLVKGAAIVQVGQNIHCADAQVIDAEGKYILPGGVDPHTHFNVSSDGRRWVDSFASGTRAAVAGGTTTIVNCIEFDGTGLLSSFQKGKSEAERSAACNYALCVMVPDYSDKHADEMTALVKMHGINSFEFSTGRKNSPLMDDTKLYGALKHCREIGALARVHSEHGNLIALKEEEFMSSKGSLSAYDFLSARPQWLEADCVTRTCSLAMMAECPLDVLYVLNCEVADVISKARRRGQMIFSETTTAATAADGCSYFDRNWCHAVAHLSEPPLRPDANIKEFLIERLGCGELQMLASSHCPYNERSSSKEQNFYNLPKGTVGVEERMMLLWSLGVNAGRLDPMRFVAVTSSNAAKMFNIYPKKGRIAVGSDADLVIWHPGMEKTISARCHNSLADYNIFEGFRCTGVPWMTMVGGKVVYENGDIKDSAAAAAGSYLPLAPFSPYVYGRLLFRDDKAGDRSKMSQTMVVGSSPSANRSDGAASEFHNRPTTKAGSRNLLDSTFALSGAQVDDNQGAKRLTRVTKPPGGESHGIW